LQLCIALHLVAPFLQVEYVMSGAWQGEPVVLAGAYNFLMDVPTIFHIHNGVLLDLLRLGSKNYVLILLPEVAEIASFNRGRVSLAPEL
jgi:hypothetical protein